jgi:dihydroxyacetone kinase
VWGSEEPPSTLPEDEMEIGVGIHGEPGRARMPLKPADEIVEMLMEPPDPSMERFSFRMGRCRPGRWSLI